MLPRLLTALRVGEALQHLFRPYMLVLICGYIQDLAAMNWCIYITCSSTSLGSSSIILAAPSLLVLLPTLITTTNNSLIFSTKLPTTSSNRFIHYKWVCLIQTYNLIIIINKLSPFIKNQLI